MDGRVPANPLWCSACLRISFPRLGGICEDHRGPSGKSKTYKGDNLYVPSEWVLEVVGSRYRGHDAHTYKVIGYDPRCGFLIQDEAASNDVRDISERAIGRTFHKI